LTDSVLESARGFRAGNKGTSELGKIACLPWLFLANIIREGDHVVDATAGNGRDTLALARLVGAQGRVEAFDIQEDALAKARELAEVNHVGERIRFWLRDHAELVQVVAPGIRAAVFNLGYLPGGDHEVTTRSLTTLSAVRGAMGLLCSGGAVIVTVYRGHPGGAAEGRCLEEFLREVSPQEYTIMAGNYLNHEEKAPYWVIIQAKGR